MGKRKGRGNSKGSAYERLICKRLSMWWSGGSRDDLYWRSSQSGGRATTRRKQGLSTAFQEGDVAATDPKGISLLRRVVIEIKRGYNASSVQDLFDNPGKPSIFKKWTEKAEEDREAADVKYWWLIAKRDRREAVIYMPAKCYSSIKSQLGDAAFNKTISVMGIRGMLLDDFLLCYSPKMIKKALPRKKI